MNIYLFLTPYIQICKKQKFLSKQLFNCILNIIYFKIKMSWFNKKESVSENKSLLPDLPSSPPINPNAGLTPEELSTIDLPEVEINDVPSLPNLMQNKNSNEIKQIDPKKDSSEMQRSGFQPIAPPKGYNQNLQPTNKFVNIKEKPVIESRIKPVFEKDDDEVYSRHFSKKEPVYVRLDKFETTLDAFEEIKIKVNEIEKLLSKSREIKSEEEKELEEWEKEVHLIKSRLDSIDKNMFSKFS